MGRAESPTSHFRQKPLRTQLEHDAWLSLSRGSGHNELDIAVREYAPGAEVVIDGLVHRSEDVKPAWSARADESHLEICRPSGTAVAAGPSAWCGAFPAVACETYEPNF